VHHDCGQETEVSGDDFARLANPFAWVSQTYCAACETFASVGRFSWADTSATAHGPALRHRGPGQGSLSQASARPKSPALPCNVSVYNREETNPLNRYEDVTPREPFQ
jgi:hypothetical protein